MSAPRKGVAAHAGIGLRAVKGGAVAVAVSLEAGEPRVLLSTMLATGAEGDRLSLEPYRMAAAMARGPQGRATAEALAAVTEGRGRQIHIAANGLQEIFRTLDAAGCTPVVAALLINRAGWVTDLLEYSLAWPDHVPVAEGLAVRESLRGALAQSRVETVELDEKSLPDLAAKNLALSTMQIDARLKALGTAAGKPWRKEQKLACLSAWAALVAHR